MGYLVAIVLFLIAFIQHYNRKTWVHPDTIFCYEWSFISFLAAMHLFTMYPTSEKTWLIIAIGSTSFCMGVYCGGRTKIGSCINQQGCRSSELFYSNHTFWIVAVILLILSIQGFLRSVILMRQGISLGDIRMASYGIIEVEGYKFDNGGFAQISALIRGILRYTLVATALEAFVFDIKKGAGKIIIVLVIELIITFTSGGRFALAYMIIELLTCFGIYKKYGRRINYDIPIKVKIWIGRITFLLVALILIVTLIRGAQISDLLVKYYRYICGNIKFFDLHVKQLDKSNFLSLGYAGLYGMWCTLLPFLHIVGFYYPDLYLKAIDCVMNTQDFMQIGGDMYTNAFITPFYHLYADFRMLGVVYGMFIFGVIAGYIFNKVSKTMQPKYIIVYLVMVQMIFKSLQIYPLVSDLYFWGAIYMFAVVKIRKGRN